MTCKGCTNIQMGDFPFGRSVDGVKLTSFIDTEHCGLFDTSDGKLFIHYCPVCGAELS